MGEECEALNVKGVARGLAVANGRLYVATENGSIHCYVSENENKNSNCKSLLPPLSFAEKDIKTGKKILRLLRKDEILRGFALVLESEKSSLAGILATETQLKVLKPLVEDGAIHSARNRLLDTSLYGTRLTVDEIDHPSSLPYPPYFANLIVVTESAAEISWQELYRVLRPCGGLLVCLGGKGDELAGLADIEDNDEIWKAEGMTILARGKLPGAFDWDSTVSCDNRVTAPLELLWYGGAGPSRQPNRHGNGMAPIAANGRYFVIGEHGLTAMDAYNGTELWLRILPYAFKSDKGNALKTMAVDDESVYLNFGDVLYELNAADGRQMAVFGDFKKPVNYNLKKTKKFNIELDKDHTGHVILRADEEGLTIKLLTDLIETSGKDLWELFIDFRAPEKRHDIYGPGVAIFTINIGNAAISPILFNHAGHHLKLNLPKPELDIVDNSDEGGEKIICRISWKAVKDFAGRPVKEFAFATTLQAYSRGEKRTKHRYLFADKTAGIVNNGWGVFAYGDQSAKKTKIPVVDGTFADLPERVRKWARLPSRPQGNPYRKWSRPTRINPLTGVDSSQIYCRAYGCTRSIPSATMDFFRSATIAYYDYEKDFGIRNFGGIRSGCASPGSMMPALGLLIANGEARGCRCSYNFETSLALVPVETPKNEYWAVFHDNTPRGAALKHLSINIGAPGDRRDSNGSLWVGYPRSKQIEWNAASRIPFHINSKKAPRFFRFNSDRVLIDKTDSPWIYSSGSIGIEKAVIDLAFYDDQGAVLSHPAKTPPEIDGNLTDSCWDGAAPAPFDDKHETAYVRHDSENLYIGYNRKRIVDRFGKTPPIIMSAIGEDAPVWQDDSIEVYLRDPDQSKVIQLGCTAFGARYDRRWETVFNIPRIKSVKIDADSTDWNNRGLAIDLFKEGECTLGWNTNGILIFAELAKDFSITKADLDALILVVADIGKNKHSFVELAIDPSSAANIIDHRLYLTEKCRRTKDSTTTVISTSQTENRYIVEALIPWIDLGITPKLNTTVAFPIAFYNSADIDPRFRRKGAWRHNQILKDLSSICRLRLSETSSPPCKLAAFPLAEEGLMLETTLSTKEDKEWDGAWVNDASVKKDCLSTEIRIPWKDLENEGLNRNNLKIALINKGLYGDTPVNLLYAMRKDALALYLRGEPLPEKRFTVRLHFSEPHDIETGQRIFDVKLQGHTVLKNLDIFKETGKKNTALVKEFIDVAADTAITVDMISKTPQNAPVLNGIEIDYGSVGE